MKPFNSRVFTPWWMALFALLLASCGSSNDPVSPTVASVNQVTALNSTVPDNFFSASLAGSEQVPPNTSTASGTSVVVVDPNSLSMKATIVTADIVGTAAHIHVGVPGVAGPVVFAMTETVAGSGIWTTTATLTTDQLNSLKAGNYYANVHSSAFPEGEIRGQLLAQIVASGQTTSSTASTSTSTTTSSLTSTATGDNTGTATASTMPSATTSTGDNASGASTAGTDSSSGTAATVTTTASVNRPLFYTNLLSGSLAVPANSSIATAFGVSVFRPADKSLTSIVISNGIIGTGATIRQAEAGTNGPLVASMSETSAGSGIWSVKATLTDTQIQALQSGSMYYEIASTAFPDGELRGQIITSPGYKKTGEAVSSTVTTGTTTGTATGTTTGTTETTVTTVTSGTTSSTATPITTLSGTGVVQPTATTTATITASPVATP